MRGEPELGSGVAPGVPRASKPADHRCAGCGQFVGPNLDVLTDAEEHVCVPDAAAPGGFAKTTRAAASAAAAQADAARPPGPPPVALPKVPPAVG